MQLCCTVHVFMETCSWGGGGGVEIREQAPFRDETSALRDSRHWWRLMKGGHGWLCGWEKKQWRKLHKRLRWEGRQRLETEVFRYPGLLSVVLGHLALLHELVWWSSFQCLKSWDVVRGWEGVVTEMERVKNKRWKGFKGNKTTCSQRG